MYCRLLLYPHLLQTDTCFHLPETTFWLMDAPLLLAFNCLQQRLLIRQISAKFPKWPTWMHSCPCTLCRQWSSRLRSHDCQTKWWQGIFLNGIPLPTKEKSECEATFPCPLLSPQFLSTDPSYTCIYILEFRWLTSVTSLCPHCPLPYQCCRSYHSWLYGHQLMRTKKKKKKLHGCSTRKSEKRKMKQKI